KTFYGAVNLVKPSFIRVDADEVTYNLHILLRFEIERDIMENRVQPEDLPEIWRDKMKAYLGIVPATDREGVLQDVHWSLGAIGYFPTYTLGNLYSVQFFNCAKEDVPDMPKLIAAGNFTPVKIWLNEHIHRWGRTFTANSLVARVTGKPRSLDPSMAYLEAKYGDLYQLQGARMAEYKVGGPLKQFTGIEKTRRLVEFLSTRMTKAIEGADAEEIQYLLETL